MSQEKRQSHRSPIELAASFGIPESLPDTEEAQTLDVSAGGFCISSPTMIPDNHPFFLAVDLNNNEQVTIQVKAVWSKPQGDAFRVGVQIVDDQNSSDVQTFLKFYNALQ